MQRTPLRLVPNPALYGHPAPPAFSAAVADSESVAEQNGIYKFSFTMQSKQEAWTVAQLKEKFVRLKEVLDGFPNLDDYIMQGECGENGINHVQGFIHMAVKVRVGTLGTALHEALEHKNLNIRPCSTNGRAVAAQYCMKETTRVILPVAKTGGKCQKELNPYMAKLKMLSILPTKLLPWQQALLDSFQETPHLRRVTWLHDEHGRAGKGTFCRYLMCKVAGTIVLDHGKAADLFTAVADYVDKFGAPNVVVFDLARAVPRGLPQDDLYVAIEKIKDGCFIAPKHHSRVVAYAPPHVVVMANHAPDLTKLSKDRWDVHFILGEARPKLPKMPRLELPGCRKL